MLTNQSKEVQRHINVALRDEVLAIKGEVTALECPCYLRLDIAD